MALIIKVISCTCAFSAMTSQNVYYSYCTTENGTFQAGADSNVKE